MDNYAKLVIASLALLSGAAHAGYAQLAPPAGFGGSPGNWTFAPSANDLRYGGTAYSPNALRVPGTSATMPAAYRFASNAPRIAAGIIFANPYVRAGVAIASWLGVAGIVWDAANNVWAVEDPSAEKSDGYLYSNSMNSQLSTSPAAAGKLHVLALDAAFGYSGRFIVFATNETRYQILDTQTQQNSGWSGGRVAGTCPAGWYVTLAGCVQTPPMREVSKPEFEETLAPKPMPETVPFELPVPTPLPIEQPVINPEPGPNPQPRPLFVPTGDPVPNPEYDPNSPPGPNNQPYVQPGVRVNPSPTPSEPWRVDLQPVNRPVSSPEPMPEPDSEPPENPDKPSEEEIDFCAKNPDVVACQKLGTLEPVDLSKNTVQMTMETEPGFGPSSGACPAPKTFTIMGKQMAFRWDLLCDFASQIRPLLIGFAYLSAALAFLGLSRRD